jgi:rubrerythrin
MAEKGKKAALTALKRALAIEEAGHKFYTESSAKIRNENGKRTLLGLAQDELTHIERIQKIYTALSAGETVPPIQTGKLNRAEDVFDSFRRKLPRQKVEAGTLKILDLAMEAERKSFYFYQKAESESRDSLLKEFYKRLAREENEHFEILQNTHLYLKDPEIWYAREERHMADGG